MLKIVLLLLGFQLGAAQAAEVEALVDRTKVGLGESFTYTVSVKTSESASVGIPRLPAIDNVEISTPMESVEARSTFINGQFQFIQTKNYTFVLTPTKAGKIKIGAADIVVGQQTVKTKPIEIEVLSTGAAPPQQRAQRQPPPDDPFNDPFFQDEDDLFSQLLRRRGLPPNPGQGGVKTQPVNQDEAFFIQLEVDRETVFEGEQVTASYYLMTPYNIRDIDTLKYPSLKGFWKEDIEIATRLNFQREVINGVAYNKALLASYALFPLKAGKATVDPYKAKCTVVTQANMLGLGTPYVYTKASQPVSINVKPLPKDNQPSDFSGAVGEFSVKSSLGVSGGRVPMNQPFSLKIRIEGRGNAKVVELPPFDLPPDLELYDTKTDSKFFRDGTSYKEFELFLIPRKQGKFVIPAITISSFSTAKATYVQSKTDAFEITVGEGRGGEPYKSAPMNLAGGTTEIKKNELPPPVLGWTQQSALTPTTWTTIWFIVFGGMFIALGFKARQELGLGQKKKNLKEMYHRRFKNLTKAVGQGDYRKTGAEGVNIMNFVLGQLSESGLSDGSLTELIQSTPPSVRRELEKDLLGIASYFEALAFAPEELASQLKPQMAEKVKALSQTLVRAIDIGTEDKAEKPVVST